MILSLLIGGVLLIGLVSIIGGLLYSRRTRLLTHQERMKALELGRAMPDAPALSAASVEDEGASTDTSDGASLARKCFSTTLWVGIAGFVAASGLPDTAKPDVAVAVAIAASAGAIGVTAMICGTILALKTPKAVAPKASGKPVVESDAFDVVSHPG
jgi:hypothetical protein